eukprot:TRINITY_DN12051_c0_g1_i1.p2 TRINITY_DN12051_c0_g1~~TRINITY_DN12051_c0_g1_i1.p2  ORF type:complete len:235 (+),score=138.71 TRINITY_DN12051_c0_g1_i1:40-705(+)
MGGKKIPMNKHAAAAMERKEGAKASAASAKAKAEEDALWADDGDKKGKKKAQKDADKAQKDREKEAKKEEKKALEREEEASTKAKGNQKITRYQMEMEKTKPKPKPSLPANVVSVEKQNHDLMKENINKKNVDVEATGLKDAVAQLERVDFKTDLTDEQHPERRMKAAHKAFEEKMIPILKADNPGLKHSQLKEMAWKEWQKSPENPLVQEMMRRHQGMQQ